MDVDRLRCRGCAGTGQLAHTHSATTFKVDRKSNTFCWFCLGIGVLPVQDLQGFLVAQNPPNFSTIDHIRANKATPHYRFHLLSGKYPLSRTRFTKSSISPMHLTDQFEAISDPNSTEKWDCQGVLQELSKVNSRIGSQPTRKNLRSLQETFQSIKSTVTGAFRESVAKFAIHSEGIASIWQQGIGQLLSVSNNRRLVSSSDFVMNETLAASKTSEKRVSIVRKRLPRRDRSRVREKAEKEAKQKAIMKERNLTPIPEDYSVVEFWDPDQVDLT